jgi:hypothetical protein
MTDDRTHDDDEARNREIITKIMGRTGAVSVNGLADKAYIRVKRTTRVERLLGAEQMKRAGVPAMLAKFEPRMYKGERHQCVVARYHDKSEFWVPVTSMMAVFEFIDDVEEELTTTWIPKKKLEAGW